MPSHVDFGFCPIASFEGFDSVAHLTLFAQMKVSASDLSKPIELDALPSPLSFSGRSLPHGSVLDFESMPVKYHRKQALFFSCNAAAFLCLDMIFEVR